MKKRKTGINRAKAIIALLAVFVLVIVLFQFNHKSAIIRFVENHSDELMRYAEDMIQTGSNGESEIYGDYEMTYWADTGMVEFVARKTGIGASSVYEGFYYSLNDMPLGFQGNQVDFTVSDSGWTWKESIGDNWEYTEKIQNHWYWFEFHF